MGRAHARTAGLTAVVAALLAAFAPTGTALAEPKGTTAAAVPVVHFAGEGGWAGLRSPGYQSDFRVTVQDGNSRENFFHAGHGWYWRGEAGVLLPGHSVPGGFASRLGVVVQGWKGSESETGSQFGRAMTSITPDNSFSQSSSCIADGLPCTYGRLSLQRRYWEIVPQLFAEVVHTPQHRLWLGLEAAFGELSENGRTSSLNGADSSTPLEQMNRRQSDLFARVFGLSLAAEGEHRIDPRLRLLARAAVGYMQFDSSATTFFSFGSDDSPLTTAHSRKVHAFRGQLGLGTEYDLTPNVALGIMGRLDYWSAMPVFQWPAEPGQFNHIGSGDMFSGFIGGRLTVRTAAR